MRRRAAGRARHLTRSLPTCLLAKQLSSAAGRQPGRQAGGRAGGRACGQAAQQAGRQAGRQAGGQAGGVAHVQQLVRAQAARVQLQPLAAERQRARQLAREAQLVEPHAVQLDVACRGGGAVVVG
jgi:hypothetical protein